MGLRSTATAAAVLIGKDDDDDKSDACCCMLQVKFQLLQGRRRRRRHGSNNAINIDLYIYIVAACCQAISVKRPLRSIKQYNGKQQQQLLRTAPPNQNRVLDSLPRVSSKLQAK